MTYKKTRTCGNCCYCKSESVYATCGRCALLNKPVTKGTVADGKCTKHLYKNGEEK